MKNVLSAVIALVLIISMLAVGCGDLPNGNGNGNGNDNGDGNGNDNDNGLVPGWTSTGTGSGELNDIEVSVTWDALYEPAEPFSPMAFTGTWKGAPAEAFPVSPSMTVSELLTLLGIITINANTGCSGLDEGIQSIHELVGSSYQVERVIKVFIWPGEWLIEPGDHFVEIAMSGEAVGIWPNENIIYSITGEWSEQPATSQASLPLQLQMELTQDQAGTLQGKTRLVLEMDGEEELAMKIDTLYTFDPAGRPLLAEPMYSVIQVDSLEIAYDDADDAWIVSLTGQGWYTR